MVGLLLAQRLVFVASFYVLKSLDILIPLITFCGTDFLYVFADAIEYSMTAKI